MKKIEEGDLMSCPRRQLERISFKFAGRAESQTLRRRGGAMSPGWSRGESSRTAAPTTGRDMKKPHSPDLMKPKEVAALLNVAPQTVVSWANTGKILSIRTPTGHRRYYRAEIEALRRWRDMTQSAER